MTDTTTRIIRTPDQRLRVFVSSTLQELAEERRAAREAIERLHLAPVMFELGARPHPPKDLYRAYLDQSHIFVGIYWQKYGWVAPDMDVSGLEDEYNLSGDKPKLIYFKSPAPEREARLKGLIDRIRSDDRVSYKAFATPAELRDLIENDLAMLLSESFESVKPAEPPAAPAAESKHRSNLPVPPTPLIGRESELAALRDLLRRADAPLITLIGPGGIGKSRLALQAALDSIEHFSDGAYLVPLATISDPAHTAAAIANTLALHESLGRTSLTEGLIDYLRDKQLLLILDNFEQIIDAAAFVAALLQACTQLKIMTTSRMPLRVRGEREFAVGPLELPQPADLTDRAAVDALLQCSAIALFVQRACEARSSFALTLDNAATIAEICRRLDGLPLAIELAAARTRVLTPTELLRRLAISLDVLSGGARDLPERQRTLHNAITWSYNLLDPVRQRLFRRLSVFTNGWTLEAAEEICNADGALAGDIFDHIAMLIDNSLILRADSADGEPRFSLLQTMRDYAREALSEGGEEFDLRRRHAEYFLALAVNADQQLHGPDQLRWLDRLETEYANVRAAFEWFLSQPDRLDAAIDIAGSLGWFWYIRGRWSEGRHWLDEALTKQATTGSTHGRARALNMLGLLAAHQGDSALARSSLGASSDLARATHDLPRLAYALMILSLETQWREDLSAARAMSADSIALFREIGDQWGLAYALYIDGMAAFWQGDHIATRKAYTESIALFRAVGARWRAAGPLGRLGDLDYRQGNYPAARALYEESQRLYRELNDLPGIASALNPLGDVARALGDLDQAVAYYQESVTAHQQLGDKYALAWAQHGLAVVAAQRRDFDQAIALLPRVIALLSEVGDSGGVPWAMQTLGYVKVAQGNFAGAKTDFEVAAQLARKMNHTVTLALCFPGLARSWLGLQHIDRAARLIGQAETLQAQVAQYGSAADVADYARRLNEARAQIEAAQWAAEIDVGRGLSLDQAFEFLISD